MRKRHATKYKAHLKFILSRSICQSPEYAGTLNTTFYGFGKTTSLYNNAIMKFSALNMYYCMYYVHTIQYL